MIRVGKWIAKHRVWILIVAIALLVPAAFGMAATKVNYDLLTYLPENLETVQGQNILVDEFGMGAYTMIIVDGMQQKEVAALKEKVAQVDHVSNVLWYDSVLDISVPIEMVPEDLREKFFRGDATMMIALLDNSTSSDESMGAVDEIRKIMNEQCFASGMTSLILDVKNMAQQEVPIYVTLAVIFSLVVLFLAMESFVVPILFMLSIGMAILYNMGTNILLGKISYVTQAIAAVLQLGVTMDYSIFLLNSYEDYKKNRYPDDKERAMGHAIAATFKSVIGSSITTIAGFIALCFMTFTLGMDMGVVMAKGVVFGVIGCVTILPSLVLCFDRLIDRTTHRPLLPDFKKASAFITKHYILWIVIFAALLAPAIYGNNHVKVYYNMDRTLPSNLPSQVANQKLNDEFNMNVVHMILLEKGIPAKDKIEMLDEIEQVDGISWALGSNSLVGPTIPESMIPDKIKSMLESDHYELEFVSSTYHVATEEMTKQLDEIQKIVHKYSENSMVIGEAPLTEDLVAVTATDFRNVSTVSIAAIFVIIMLVFKSISLPVILVAVIEFAIFVNMSCAYYMNTTLAFICGIIIGTVQLGSTVDYAILMTSRYQKERALGKSKKESISIAHSTSMKSIIISGCTFFAATFGVGLYSKVDMISSICILLARGALISSVVVIFILPSMFTLLDPIITHTSVGFLPKKKK